MESLEQLADHLNAATMIVDHLDDTTLGDVSRELDKLAKELSACRRRLDDARAQLEAS